MYSRLKRSRLVRPGSWPVRWRIAAASAGLTLVILLVFAAVIGSVATQRIRDDFNGEMNSAVQTLAAELRIVDTLTGSYLIRGPGLDDFVLPNDATVRVFNSSEELLTENKGAIDLGPPRPGTDERDGLRVTTARINSGSGTLTGYVQYGRSLAHVDSTVERLWLFIAAGVLGGALLASLAGFVVASRAMRPVAELTATARQIATTGDPSRRMPEPRAQDEVGELTGTLEQMLRSLDAARGEREAAMQKQREFVADASHELRTPLTSILANLELLEASLRSARHGEDAAMVDSALRSSRRMSRLVADLLLLARADAGRSGAHRRCDLAEIAGDAAEEASPLLTERDLLTDVEGPVWVEGNPDELHRMILNLLDNASRHTPPGSTVELRLEAENQEAVIEVSDDGPGIPRGLRPHIFDRFARGSADTRASTGTGLGLAIVRAVATSHGGSAEATESPSGGASFLIRVPRAGDSGGGAENGGEAPARRLLRPRQDPPA
jgi:two-component system, OmpR family, sensor kinase